MPLYMQFWIDRYGYQAGYVATAALALGVSWPLAWRYLSEPHQPRTHSSRARTGEAYTGLRARQCLRQRAFWQMVFGFSLLGVFTSGLVAHLVPLLVDSGIAPELAARALSVLGAALIVGRILTGLMLDRFFAPFVVTICILASVTGVGVLWLGARAWGAFVAVALVGFTIGAELDFMSYLVSRYQGLRAYGQIYGLLYGVFIFGSGLGPLIMGYGHQVTGSYERGLAILLTVTLAALPAFMTLGRYLSFAGERACELPGQVH